MAPEVCIALLEHGAAQLTERIVGVRTLQSANHPASGQLAAAEAKSEGFVTLRHSEQWLTELARLAPQIVALPCDGSSDVIGYTLTVDPAELRSSGSNELRNI